MPRTLNADPNESGSCELHSFTPRGAASLQRGQGCFARVGDLLNETMMKSALTQYVLVAAVGGGLAALAGTAIAAEPNAWTAVAPTLATLVYLLLTGLVIGLGQGLAQVPPITWKATLGRGLQSAGIALIAGLTTHVSPDASLMVIIGVGALLSTIGAGGIQELIRARLTGSHASLEAFTNPKEK